jgi:hypothetical protein
LIIQFRRMEIKFPVIVGFYCIADISLDNRKR